MAHLADLLGTDHPLFVYNLNQMERATGGAGVDTRLIADITSRSHQILRQLKIDVKDSSPYELYQSLESSVQSGQAETILRPNDYLLIAIDHQIISLNLEDVIENAHHQIEFTERRRDHATRNLRMEIIKRYADHDKTNNHMVYNLAHEAGLKPEKDEGYENMGNTDLIENESNTKKPSMYAIGDVFSDVFIQLSENESTVEVDDNGDEWLKMPFGSKPPYDDATTVDAVGPSPNAGVSAARLGLDVSLLAWMGDDEVADHTRKYLDNENIDHSLISSTKNTKSNTYYVLRRGAERTILVKNENYEYDWVKPSTVPDWIYLSLISNKSWQLHMDLLKYLEENPTVKLVFQPGTFHFKWGAEKLAKVYERTEIVILNKEEAVDVTGGPKTDITELAIQMHQLGPKIVIITDGMNGSYAYYDNKLVTVPNYPDVARPFDRTGAGDAFASTIVAALAIGESIETALLWAPINSMNVVQKLGAQAGLQTKQQILDWLAKAPADYKVTEI